MAIACHRGHCPAGSRRAASARIEQGDALHKSPLKGYGRELSSCSRRTGSTLCRGELSAQHDTAGSTLQRST